jgi:hypothetical protein
LRPGEKLHEELVIGDSVERTAIPKIMCAKEDYLSPEQVRSALSVLKELCEQRDCEGLRRLFLCVVDGYAPNGPLVDRLWNEQAENSHPARRAPAPPGSPPSRPLPRDQTTPLAALAR